MAETARCPICQADIPIPEDFSGRSVPCPNCGAQDEPLATNGNSPDSAAAEPVLEVAESSAEPEPHETYQLQLPETPAAPVIRSRRCATEPSSAEKDRDRRGWLAQVRGSLNSTIVGFVLIALVLRLGFGYVMSVREEALDPRRPSAEPRSTPEISAPKKDASKAVSNRVEKKGQVAIVKPGSKDNAANAAAEIPSQGGPFTQRTVTTYDGPIANLVVGGSGRFLILHLKSQRKLAVHDLQRDAVAFTVPLAEDDILAAAGRERLWVFLLKAHVVQCWNLQRGERESEQVIPVAGPLKAAVVGADSEGPILCLHPRSPQAADFPIWSFVIAETLVPQEIRSRLVEAGKIDLERLLDHQFRHRSTDVVHARASADGRVFAVWTTSYSPQGVGVMSVSPSGVELHPARVSAGYLAPSASGQWLLSERGLTTLNASSTTAPTPLPTGGFPAVDESLYLARLPDGTLELRMLEGDTLLARLPKFDLPRPTSEDFAPHDFTQDKRLTLVARLGCLAYVPPSNDQLVTYRFDLAKLLRDAGVRPLMIASRPPTSVSRAQRLDYEIQIRNAGGPVSYRLDFAPAGMSLSDAGKLSWEVPADFSEPEVTVIIAISDLAGGEQFHAFVVRVDR